MTGQCWPIMASGLFPSWSRLDSGVPNVLAVHCVKMQPEDLDILIRHDVKISHNPVSNMYLGVGVAPVLEMRQPEG